MHFALALSVLILAAPTNALYAQSVTWEGSTSQNRPLSFAVADGALASLSLDWVLPLEDGCATPGAAIGLKETGARETVFFYSNSPGNEPPRIASDGFTLTRILTGPPARVTGVITGRFDSPNEAQGTLILTSEGCRGTAKLNWTATRKNTNAPASNTSPASSAAPLVSGQLLDSGGRPVREADVRPCRQITRPDGTVSTLMAMYTDGTWAVARTDDDGRFVFDKPLAPAKYCLSVQVRRSRGFELGTVQNASGEVFQFEIRQNAGFLDLGSVSVLFVK